MSWTLLPASAFGEHAVRWDKLNDETAKSPLLAVPFVVPLLAQFGNGKEKLAIYERQGQLLAMAIVRPHRRGVWETFQPSQAPIGMWLQHPGADIETLMHELLRCLPGMPMVLGMTQRDPEINPRPRDSTRLRTVDYVNTARIPIKGTFEAYWSSRGKNLRANLRKQRTKLDKEGITARLEITREPELMAKALADYGRLESAGWKAANGTAIHPDNAQGRFYLAMLEGFARRGAARVYRYWFNDKVVSMNLCIEGNGSLIVLKTTYDENLTSHYSPSFLMREETCQHMFEEQKFDRLEFYGKVMEWHIRWTEDIRTMYHINNYRWGAVVGLSARAKKSRTLVQGMLQPRQPATAAAATGEQSGG